MSEVAFGEAPYGVLRPPAPEEFRTALAGWFRAHRDELSGVRAARGAARAEAHEVLLDFQRRLYDTGWTRWGWSPGVGGLGGSAIHRGILYDEVWAAGLAITEGVFAFETMAEMLVRFDPELAARFLPAAMRGDDFWCQGFSEPEAGSDLAALRTRATPDDEHWALSGQKVWTSNADVANRCFVLARSNAGVAPHRGLSMFLVDLAAPGVTVRPLLAMTGEPEFAEVFLDNVRVSRDRLIGQPGQGWTQTMYLLQWERSMYGWQRQAWLHSRLGDLLGEAGAADRPAELGAAFVAVSALRARCRDSLRALSRGESPGPEISVDKILLASAEQLVMDVAREVLGDRLHFDDDRAAVKWRRDFMYSRAASIYGGSAEIQRSIIAERCLGLPREPARAG
jgi:alkylation response protein AidB-like acyl-CoA dehydrogenase